jgi:putative copper export protein
VVGGATNLVMPALAAMMRQGGTPAGVPAVMKRFGLLGQAALAVLVVTGALMLGLRYGGDAVALGPWFLMKLALVVVVLGTVLLRYIPVGQRLPPAAIGMVTRFALVGIVILSVATFE